MMDSRPCGDGDGDGGGECDSGTTVQRKPIQYTRAQQSMIKHSTARFSTAYNSTAQHGDDDSQDALKEVSATSIA
jgi:hypothetical protein